MNSAGGNHASEFCVLGTYDTWCRKLWQEGPARLLLFMLVGWLLVVGVRTLKRLFAGAINGSKFAAAPALR